MCARHDYPPFDSYPAPSALSEAELLQGYGYPAARKDVAEPVSGREVAEEAGDEPPPTAPPEPPIE